MNADNNDSNENEHFRQLERQLEQVIGRLAALEQAAARAPAPPPVVSAPPAPPAAASAPSASPPQPAPPATGLAPAAGGGTPGPGAATVPQLGAFPGPGGVPGPGAFPGPGGEQAVFTYSGQGRLGGSSSLGIHKRARLSEIMDADPDAVARIFAALASPARITLLRALLNGPRNSQELRRELDDPSAGQLYHHLRELLAAGLVVQPARSVYAIPRGTEVDICIEIAVAAQRAAGSNRYPPPEPEQPDEDLPEAPGSQQ